MRDHSRHYRIITLAGIFSALCLHPLLRVHEREGRWARGGAWPQESRATWISLRRRERAVPPSSLDRGSFALRIDHTGGVEAQIRRPRDDARR